MCARIPISLDTCKGLCPPFHYTQTHSLSHTHKQLELGFHHNPQTYSQTHIYTYFHTLSLVRTEALMLLRLIISQVCHLIFIWASEVLTSISLSCFAFSLFCHLSAFSTLFTSVSPFFFSLSLSLRLPPVYPILLRQEFYRLCSVSDPMKNCQRQGGEKEALCCIKIRPKQRCGFVSGDCCKFYSRKMVSAVLL